VVSVDGADVPYGTWILVLRCKGNSRARLGNPALHTQVSFDFNVRVEDRDSSDSPFAQSRSVWVRMKFAYQAFRTQ